jgi:hypothetical protein
MAFNVAGALTMIAIVNPTTGLPAALLVLIFVLIRRYYLKAASSLKRLETVGEPERVHTMSTPIHSLIELKMF